jgi:hypothetical protein
MDRTENTVSNIDRQIDKTAVIITPCASAGRTLVGAIVFQTLMIRKEWI